VEARLGDRETAGQADGGLGEERAGAVDERGAEAESEPREGLLELVRR
jgi:hypothetical protein